jgi:hypothetical protein
MSLCGRARTFVSNARPPNRRQSHVCVDNLGNEGIEIRAFLKDTAIALASAGL